LELAKMFGLSYLYAALLGAESWEKFGGRSFVVLGGVSCGAQGLPGVSTSITMEQPVDRTGDLGSAGGLHQICRPRCC
jgi:hypothetical protein